MMDISPSIINSNNSNLTSSKINANPIINKTRQPRNTNE